jgi:putative DNA primase/helicase
MSKKELRDLTKLSDLELALLEKKYLDEEDRYRKAGLRMESTAGINAMIEQLKDLPGIRCSINDFDAHPLWLNTDNCTLDLATGETWEHRPDDLFTKVTTAGFNLAAECPVFTAFMERIVPDPDTRAFVQRAVGYCLSDLTGEQCMFFLYGLGRNGKSTFLNIIRKVLGDYAMTTAASTLMVKRQGDERRNDIAVLKGARMVTATEAEDGQHMAEAMIKEVTGGDPVTCRLLYAEFFTFTPSFKIWLAANHKPVVKGQDLGIWRRIHLVPFEQTIPVEEVDKDLPAKLEAELDGILAWAYRGWLQYREIGLAPSKEVVDGTAQYRLEMDPLAEFLTEACWSGQEGAGKSCLNGILYQAYYNWAKDNGVAHPMTQKKLSMQLKERGFVQKTAGDGSRWWLDIKNKVEPRAF